MRKALFTLVLTYLAVGSLTGCGLFDAWRENARTPSQTANWTKPNRTITPALPTSNGGGGGGNVLPSILPDRVPSAPRFLPMSGQRVPVRTNEKIEVVPTVLETPHVLPIENVVTPKIKADPPKAIEQLQGVSEPSKVVPAKAAASVSNSHADGYRTLVGQVQQFRKTWRLRYSSIEQDDPHGGSVILECDGDLSALRDGTTIRVRGVLIPASDRSSGARYRVQSFEILE